MSEAGVDVAACYVRSDRVVGRRIAEEYILVPLAGRGADVDAILNLNRVGAFIWERLDGRTDGRAIVEALVASFEVEAERAARDYAEFLARLIEAHVVRAAGAPAGDSKR